MNAKLFKSLGHQAVQLPNEFRFPGEAVWIYRDGARVVLEPINPSAWPKGFFDSIRINDPAFKRPSQGRLPNR